MKLSISLITVLLVCFNLSAQDTIPLWFTDDFKDNVNRWYHVGEYQEDTYHNALYVNSKKDFRLVAEFDSKNVVGDDRWGMIWGRKNGYDYYQFDINTNGEFQVGYRLNGQYNVLEPWRKKKKFIKSDYNKLEVRKEGETLFFLINDHQVHKMPFMQFYNTGVGLKSLSKNVKFKKFSIYQDMGEINVAEEVKTLKLERQNLGDQVNSSYIDKRPVISPDGKTLYFIVEDHPQGFGGQDIYVSTTEDGSTWTKAKNIGRPLNNQISNFVNTALPDNNTLLVINAYGRYNPDAIIALTHRVQDGWSQPEGKVINRLQKTGKWVSFSLGADGKTLVYSMARPDAIGGRDLYVSFLLPNGNFSTPKNLGSTINTSGNEHCPFLAADGKTLYFDTDGHPGYGGRDIFMSRRLDDSWTNWETPQNMGPIINTPDADEGLIVPASGEYAYFVSDQKSYGGYDIYRMRLPETLRPTPTALLTGKVMDCIKNLPIATTLKVYRNNEVVEMAHARTDPKTGQYKLALASGAKYKIIANYNKNEERVLDTIEIDLTEIEKYTEEEIPVICFESLDQEKKEPSKPIIRASVPNLEFENVYFASARWNLNEKAIATLNAMADSLLKYPEIQIEVIGHTDSIGTYDYNWNLAIQRSSEVIGYLETKGIERKRVVFKGWGETKPSDNNQTQKGRANNRRVEFRIVKKENL